MRCLKRGRTHKSFEELFDRSVYEYNYSVHSTTGKIPLEIVFGRTVSTGPRQFEEARKDNIERLMKIQESDLLYHNKKRQEPKLTIQET